jgi:hypothetical protein
MKWVKKGLIYRKSALQPTPWVRPNGTIRIFAGFRDNKGVSRIGYIDVSDINPARILTVSKKPVLDVGAPGTFDDNGVVPCAVVPRGKKLFLYYAGYQRSYNVRFMAYSGLAMSDNNGASFVRYTTVPILERSPQELLFRAIHTILYDSKKRVWRVWYGAGSHYIQGKKKTLPVYEIYYMESKDGIHFPDRGQTVLRLKPHEYRHGRPYVVINKNGYRMYFCYSTKQIPYRLTSATSRDGIHWLRDDSELNLTYARKDFDSTMSAYPAVVSVRGNTYLFYNGNDYGKMGIGYAIQTASSGK